MKLRMWLKTNSLGKAISIVAIGACLSACESRPASDLLAVTAKPWGANLMSSRVGPSLTKKSKAREVLVLSGGGANGAFGAGLLVGWTKSGKRPDFDIVSGVSTGALIGVLAFVGSEYDEVLERNFTNVSRSDLASPRWLTGGLKDCLADNAPLRKRIEAVIDADLLSQIADKHKAGKRLIRRWHLGLFVRRQ